MDINIINKIDYLGISKDTKIYNGLSLYQISLNLPKNMIKSHITDYLNNCLFIYENKKNKTNLGYCNLVRNSNFNLIQLYNNL